MAEKTFFEEVFGLDGKMGRTKKDTTPPAESENEENKGNEGEGDEKSPPPGAAALPDTEPVRRLKVSRASAKRQLTKFRNRLLDSSEGKEEIEAGMEMVTQLFSEFCQVHKQVQGTFDDQDLAEADAEAYDQVILDTKTALADAKRTVARLERQHRQQEASKTADLHQTAAEAAAAVVRGQGPKLSGVDLQKFSGSYEKFPGWFSLFEALVDKRQNLDRVTKFGYLRAYTTGNAAATLARFDMAPENYEPAKDLLKERFGKPKMIRKTVVKKLVTYEPPRNTAAEGRRTLDLIHGYLHTLSSVKVDIKSRELGTALIPHLEEKFPDEARAEYEKWICKKEDHFQPTVEEFCKVIDDALEPMVNREKQNPPPQKVVKATALSGAKLDGDQEPGQTGKKKKKGPKVAGSANPQSAVCVFCGDEGHRSTDCSEGQKMDVDTRWQKVNQAHACYLCLKKGHQTRNCQAQKKECPVEGCQKAHHRLLHAPAQTK